MPQQVIEQIQIIFGKKNFITSSIKKLTLKNNFCRNT